MSRAKDLFSRLQKDGLAALEQLIEDREPESLFLDFKRSPADGQGPRLSTDDNKNLSRAISGFGNSEGGLLIWGVDCRRDAATGTEIVQKHSLVDARGFRTKIEGALSRLTVPPHPSVRTFEILEPGGGSGYLVVLVPKSQIGPLRSVSTNHYHLRSGSDFSIVPHDALAGMFGRNPRPIIHPNFLMRFARLDERRESLLVSIGIAAVNVGAVLAERPYLSIWLGNLPAGYVGAALPNADAYSLRRGNLPGISVVGRVGTAIPPSATDELCDLVFHLPLGYRSDIELQCSVGSHGAEPSTFVIGVSGVALTDIVERAMKNEGLLASDVFRVESSHELG